MSLNVINVYIYPLVNYNRTMENHHFQWVNPLYMAMFNSYVSLPEGNSHPPRWIYANIHLIYNAVIRSHLFLSVSRPIVLTFLGIAALFLIWDVTRKSRQATPKVVLEAVERPEAAGNPGNHRLNWHLEDGEDGGWGLNVEGWGIEARSVLKS